METPTPAMVRLAKSREQAEARLSTLRESLSRELGFAPRRIWWVPVVGFAFGIAMSRAVGGKRKKSS